MKKLLAILLLSACAQPAFAVNDLLAPKGEEGVRLWSNFIKPGVRTRLQYDDNVTTSKPKESAWMGVFGPRLQLKLPYEHSYIGASGEYVGRYYGNRLGGDSADNDAFVDVALRHDISERLSLGLKQFFAYQQQPSITLPPGGDTADLPILLENEANYLQFVNTTGVEYRMNKWLSATLSHELEILDFESANNLVPDSLNIMQNRIAFDINYRMWTDTLFGVGYRFTKGDYETIDKDFNDHLVSAVMRHRMAKDLIIFGRVGYEYRAPKQKNYIVTSITPVSSNEIPGANESGANNKNRFSGPYVELDLTYLFTQATQVKVGYKLRQENSPQPGFFDRRVQGVYGAFTHKLTRKTQVMLFGYQDKSDYRDNRVFGQVTPVSENLYKFGFLMTQQLKPWMFLELGYRYVDNDSQFSQSATQGINQAGQNGGANSDYQRNRVFSGLNLAF